VTYQEVCLIDHDHVFPQSCRSIQAALEKEFCALRCCRCQPTLAVLYIRYNHGTSPAHNRLILALCTQLGESQQCIHVYNLRNTCFYMRNMYCAVTRDKLQAGIRAQRLNDKVSSQRQWWEVPYMQTCAHLRTSPPWPV
jgi:hypothetical protein